MDLERVLYSATQRLNLIKFRPSRRATEGDSTEVLNSYGKTIASFFLLVYISLANSFTYFNCFSLL